MNDHKSVPKVDVIVVLWKSLPFLDELFAGFTTLDYPRDACTVHIVDNASPDGAGEEVQRRLSHPDPALPRIILHEPGTNLGFSGGNNLVMRASSADYCYLLNHDAAFEPGTLREAIAAAEADSSIGSVQSLIVLMQDPDTINSTGNVVHIAGFGYCNAYTRPVSEAPTSVVPIGYASGAGVLYRMNALRKVGYLDEMLFAYHEDLDLGWRLLLAGYENVLAPKSVLRHRYEFSRSIAKWYWMERNRSIVMLYNYRLPTLVVLAPLLIGIELAIWFFALLRGFVKEKAKAAAWFFKKGSWSSVLAGRRHAQALRVRSDRQILKRFAATIGHQDVESPVVDWVANPLMRLYAALLLIVVWW